MIADPAQIGEDVLDSWARDLDNYGISDALGGFAARTPLAREKMQEWMQSDEEWVEGAGWLILAVLAGSDPSLPDAFFEPYLDTIERDIHTRKNRVRHEMNNALLAIGIGRPALTTRALDVAARIGKVKVDHGQTACKTPDATAYIQKAIARKAVKA